MEADDEVVVLDGPKVIVGKPDPVKLRGGLHSVEDHNFWINRIGTCPYCLSGSTVVPKCVILEALKK